MSASELQAKVRAILAAIERREFEEKPLDARFADATLLSLMGLGLSDPEYPKKRERTQALFQRARTEHSFAFDQSDLDECTTLLTAIYRGERFYEGTVLAALKERILHRLLHRIETLTR